jgi:Radical SAM superfamily
MIFYQKGAAFVMKLNILLVNPWIYDFAAYNFWARPLGLLKVAECLSAFDARLTLIDCTDAFSVRRYGTGKFRAEIVPKPDVVKAVPRLYRRYGISIDEFRQRVENAGPVDIILMTSIMSYWYPGVQKAIEILKETAGDVPVVLGGIYSTLYRKHASQFSGADFIYSGALSRAIRFVLSTFGFRLEREGKEMRYYSLGLFGIHHYAPLLSSTGCPFRCNYCASGVLAGNFRKREPSEVVKEITELHTLGIRDFAFYDDALLADSEDHIKPILKDVVSSGLHARFHTPNGLHARFMDEELASLMKRAGFRTIRLGLETIDDRRQYATGGKVHKDDVARAVSLLKGAGIPGREIGVYLMYGLPGQGLREVKDGVRFVRGLGVRVYLTEFAPIRGTGSWNELVGRGVFDDDLDPLCTNNTVYSCLYAGYEHEEIEEMRLDVKTYNAAL